jgi:hypothetical protein
MPPPLRWLLTTTTRICWPQPPPELLLLPLLLPLQHHAPLPAAPDHNVGAAVPAPATMLHRARHLLLRGRPSTSACAI